MTDDILSAEEREVLNEARLLASPEGRYKVLVAIIDRLCARVRAAEAKVAPPTREQLREDCWTGGEKHDARLDAAPPRQEDAFLVDEKAREFHEAAYRHAKEDAWRTKCPRCEMPLTHCTCKTNARPADPPRQEEPMYEPNDTLGGFPRSGETRPPDPPAVAEVRERLREGFGAEQAVADRATMLKFYDEANGCAIALERRYDEAVRERESLYHNYTEVTTTQADRIRELEQELGNIVTVDWRNWDKESRDPLEWVQWAKSRARAVLAKGVKP